MTGSSALEVAALAARALERLGIPYVVVGSVASSLHGEPRGTLDVDMTLRLRPSDVAALCAAFERDFFIDAEGLQESIRTGLPTNAIHRTTHVKLDLYVRENEGIDAEELRRARHVRLTGEKGSEARVASAEDTVLQKLLSFQKGGEVSDRQWRDVLGVLKTQGPALESGYLEEWAPRLGVTELLERARSETGPV